MNGHMQTKGNPEIKQFIQLLHHLQSLYIHQEPAFLNFISEIQTHIYRNQLFML